MTYTEDIIDDQDLDEGSEYPSAFGITFSPQVQGIAIAIVGLIGAIYVGFSFIKPAWEEVQTLKTTRQEKQDQISGLKKGDPQALKDLENKLRQTEALKPQILALFANDNTGTSFLVDLNRSILEQAKLLSFAPDIIEDPIIRDGSFGTELDGKVKLQSFNLEIEGSFEQVQTVIRNLERYQPLMFISNIRTEASGERAIKFEPGKATPIIPDIKTNLSIEFIVPRSPEEIKAEEEAAAAAAAAAAAPPPEAAPPQ
jgi:type IV pilus assembly protein PilO